MVNSLTKLAWALVNLLFSNILEIWRNLMRSRGNISGKYLLKDLSVLLGRTGMAVVFQVLAVLVFTVLPQGCDVILVAVDDMAKGVNGYGNALGLVGGTVAWSIFSEFAVRYSIYVSDNSGASLSAQRMQWRRALQQAIADIFLILPYFIVLFSLWINYNALGKADQELFAGRFRWLAGILYLVMVVVAQVYFAGRNAARRTEARQIARPETAEGQTGIDMSLNAKDWIDRLLLLLDSWCFNVYNRLFPRDDERNWCEKLTGIYNDYVFDIRDQGEFTGMMKERVADVQHIYRDLPAEKRLGFPQDKDYMGADALVPDIFRLRQYTSGGRENSRLPASYDRWQYYVPGRFYKRTHAWLAVIVFVAVLWMILVSTVLKVTAFDKIGSPLLLMGAFCSWTGIYMGVLYLDYGYFRRGAPVVPGDGPLSPKYTGGVQKRNRFADWSKRNISVRTLLLVWLLLASLTNPDHPARLGPVDCCPDTRPSLREHFAGWFSHYADSLSHRNQLYDVDSHKYVYPVVFVCAEGGALRTGAFTSLVLGMLQDSLKQLRTDSFDFRKTIYACSGVSGGSLGLACFNALAYTDEQQSRNRSLRAMSLKFYSEDYLAPHLSRWFYGDILQLWNFGHFDRWDRAVALELALEGGYEKSMLSSQFSESIQNIYTTSGNAPALFINTTEVETGLQCWISSVRPDTNDIFLADRRDLLGHKISKSLKYSTAVNFSMRFPYFNPAACIHLGPTRKLHYVDGGYYENSGAATMLEILQALRPQMDAYAGTYKAGIRPFVLMLRFSEPDSSSADLSFANEVSEILAGIYNTRAGRGALAEEAVGHYVEQMGGKLIQLRLQPDGKQVPMSWVFSNNSMRHLDAFVSGMWTARRTNELHKLPFTDTAVFRTDVKDSVRTQDKL